MTFAEQYRKIRAASVSESFAQWAGVVEDIDPDAIIEHDEHGIVIHFSDGSDQRVASFH